MSRTIFAHQMAISQANAEVAPSVLCGTLQAASLACLPVVNPFEIQIRRRFLCIGTSTAGQERNSLSSAMPENLFLLMCIPYRKHGTRLVHMDLAELVSDETLFRKLRHEYQSTKGQWASYFSLWKMAEIQFVKFGLHKHQLIDIKERNHLPPANLKHEYRYPPIPAEIIPPIGKNHLVHLYEHPDHADDVPFCLERMPKKLREQLKYHRVRPQDY